MAETPPCKRQSDDTTNMEDLVSKLPDEILSGILSLLTMKESGRTSVLSKRWINLWKFTTNLNFDALPEELTQVKYVTWVNQVLRLHKCTSLEEFRVRFDLDATFSKDIDEWIKLMISKGAKSMEIDLTSKFPYYGTNVYSLSHDCNDFIKSVSNLSNIMCLTSLALTWVNVGGELIEYLLSKCPHLEKISISYSDKLIRLKVGGHSLPLKYLKIDRCNSLETIELCAPCLVTFCYLGKPIDFVIGRNPLLSELYMAGRSDDNVVTRCLPLFSSHFSQIETMRLHTWKKDYLELPEISGLTNLKHLVWTITLYSDMSLIGVAKFIMAVPFLQKLTLRCSVLCPVYVTPREEEHAIQFHPGLKEIKMSGYVGSRSQLELASYLAKSAINLEKMVIYRSCPRGHVSKRQKKKAGKLLRGLEELRGSLTAGAKLIIL